MVLSPTEYTFIRGVLTARSVVTAKEMTLRAAMSATSPKQLYISELINIDDCFLIEFNRNQDNKNQDWSLIFD